MIRFTAAFTIFINSFYVLNGQIKLSGTIVDKTNQSAVKYANVGVPGKEVGTVCNDLGKFDLSIPDNLLNHYLVITHIGYESDTIKIGELKNKPAEIKIELQPTQVILDPVTILASEQVSLGYKPNDNKVKGFFKAAGLGLEGGTLIKNAGPVVLTQFNLNILKIPFDSLRFRLNFYSVKKDNPSTRINKKDIIFNISKADTGVYSLPLMSENIRAAGNFICTIELIELFGQPAENAEFLFSAIPDKGGSIYKKTISMGRWERIKKYSLCFWFNAKK